MKEVGFEKALLRKYPLPVVLATSLDKNNQPNIITLAWYTQTSVKPLMFAISIAHNRYSYETILSSGEFGLVFPPADWADAALFCGTRSGRETNKFQQTGLVPLKPSKIQTPLIEDANAAFECRLVAVTPTGDHSIFVGEAVAAHISDEQKPGLYLLDKGYKLGPVRSK
ncbi:MAG: flavin reductase family protein [Planctomycetota bacterium]|nr:flavin reductase family protein [Planctomycetota bacterium]